MSIYLTRQPAFFFFSSRRRHTRFDCDWSSDVCSSDLITRSGNLVIFTGTNGTQITYTNNGSTGTTQTLAITTVNNLTINLGTGSDTFTVAGLSVAGDVAINGQASGVATVAIHAATPSITIGGSINANFGSE